MKKRKKLTYLILTLFIILFIPVISYTDNIIKYLAVQGTGQASLIINSRKIDYYLKKPDFPEDKKNRLLLIREIQNFAVSDLGLKDNGSYHKMYDQKGKPLLWLVQACPPYSLEPHKWKFPVVGSLSYKGYFRKSDALKEADKLKKAGYDVSIRNPSAWSTLGYFKDPVFSEMLNWSEGELANVILHEMTHGTIFRKNNLQFNENIATFIGENGSIAFLEKKYGKKSKELKTYINEIHDDNLFYDHIMKGTVQLNNLYNSFTSDMTVDEKNIKKTALIKEIIGNLTKLPFNNKQSFEGYKDFTPNNAWFSGFRTYRNDLSDIDKDFKNDFDSDLNKYIIYLKTVK
ncbi:MAG: aminopeptidase [Spirochaetes bacterium]|nr:aminopeptidase [Spirochaetota bacterium]